ncbi:DMT family transporter, partial [Candidatus Uhrbacteria bacterium]|nr:DMT family transporter [Candidatus Uhrbacteria bacterium]
TLVIGHSPPIPLWLLVVLGAHVCNAAAFLVDKFLLARTMPKPAVYAFTVGSLSGLAAILLAFDPTLPTRTQGIVDAIAGVTFILALLLFFTALRRGEASRIVPFIGGTIPVYTFLLSYLFLHERLAQRELLAFGCLVVAAALIAREAPGERSRNRGAYLPATASAICFAVSSVLMKVVFDTQPFLSGFAWTRVAVFCAALVILLHRPTRQAIIERRERPRGRMFALFIGGQLAGAVGFLGVNYAIALASVTLVNALQGVQYAILFILVILLGRTFPQLRERLTRAIVIQKIAAILLIAVGLSILGRT